MSGTHASAREVRIPAGPEHPETPGYAALPSGAKRGVVVIHEIFGRQPEIDRVVERFAAHGYAAVAPDLFGASGKFRCIRATMRAMSTGEGPAVAHADAIRAWLSAQTGLSNDQIGIIGFCFGGGFALAVGRGWGAVSTNYGIVPGDPAVLRGMGPTIGCYGADDRLFAPMADRLERCLRGVDVEVEVHTFEGVGHSFLTDGHHPIGAALSRPFLNVRYDRDTAEAGWERILAFFDRHL